MLAVLVGQTQGTCLPTTNRPVSGGATPRPIALGSGAVAAPHRSERTAGADRDVGHSQYPVGRRPAPNPAGAALVRQGRSITGAVPVARAAGTGRAGIALLVLPITPTFLSLSASPNAAIERPGDCYGRTEGGWLYGAMPLQFLETRKGVGAAGLPVGGDCLPVSAPR
jgi:hypothetical protein